MSVTGVPSLVPGSGGKFPFAVASASSCTWTTQTDVGWADISPSSGQGNGSPSLTVSQNESSTGRSLTVIVNGQSFHVTQNNSCTYRLSPTSLDVGGAGGAASIAITVTTGCPWTATSGESWVQVRTRSGTGSGSVDLDIAANPFGVRLANLTIAGQRVTVTQQPQ